MGREDDLLVSERYGHKPIHLVGHLLLLALVAWSVAAIFAGSSAPVGVVVWLLGAVLLHDALLWPVYTLADRATHRPMGTMVNYFRIPAALSLLLIVVFSPILFGFGSDSYTANSGDEWDGYWLRWFIVTLAMFLVSGAVYLVNRSRSGEPSDGADD